MESLTSAISVQVDAYDKEIATNILKKLGLNMSTYVNMAIKQLINKDGVPFEIVNPKHSRELLDALEEGAEIEKEIKSGKRVGYRNANEMLRSILDD